MKKIWHWFLNAIAWLTQDSPRLDKAKNKNMSRPDVAANITRIRSRMGRL